jgi:hypothetical protein
MSKTASTKVASARREDLPRVSQWPLRDIEAISPKLSEQVQCVAQAAGAVSLAALALKSDSSCDVHSGQGKSWLDEIRTAVLAWMRTARTVCKRVLWPLLASHAHLWFARFQP